MIYFIQAGKNGPIKIGSSDNPKGRMANLQVANAAMLKLLWIYDGDRWNEPDIHEKLRHENIRGEWYRPGKSIFEFMDEELQKDVDITTFHGEGDICFTAFPSGSYYFTCPEFDISWDSEKKDVYIDRLTANQKVIVRGRSDRSEIVV